MSIPRSKAESLLAGLLALALLAGCSLGRDDEGASPTSARRSEDVVRALSRALDARASAVRRADDATFTRLLGGSRALREQQHTWFENLTRLPVGRLSYQLDPGSLVRDGDAYWVVVEQALELEGYDDAPVTTPDRWRFAPDARHPGRFRLTSVSDPRWERAHDVRPQPWDTGRIEVREGHGVLGIFDAASVAGAPDLLDSVESGIASVAAEVPYEWSRSVVVYALSDPRFLDSIEDLPGEHPGDLDAVAFPVGDGTRFVLNPRMLSQPGMERDRLVRHELTHVAVGARDDDVPVWLAEGLAEHVSVQPLAPQERRIPQAAVLAAESGAADLPADDSFNDAESEAHYGLAWWAVEYLVDTYGDAAPWSLLDAMSEPGADPDDVLRRQLGLTTRDLAREADRLILSLYDPSAGVL